MCVLTEGELSNCGYGKRGEGDGGTSFTFFSCDSVVKHGTGSQEN